jgi:hypothetical protein
VGGSTSTGGARPTGGGSSTGGSSSTQYIQIDHGYSTDTTLGIAGPWFTVAAPLGTTISPSCDSGGTCYDDVVGTKVCASGTSEQVPCTGSTCDYTNYWGGGIWFHFNQEDADAGVGTWDGSSYSGVAFHFDNSYTTTVRVYLKVAGDSSLNYCLDVSASGDYVVNWQQFRQDCWNGSGTSVPTTYLSQINGLSWQFSPSTLESISFKFCVSNVRIL